MKTASSCVVFYIFSSKFFSPTKETFCKRHLLAQWSLGTAKSFDSLGLCLIISFVFFFREKNRQNFRNQYFGALTKT